MPISIARLVPSWCCSRAPLVVEGRRLPDSRTFAQPLDAGTGGGPPLNLPLGGGGEKGRVVRTGVLLSGSCCGACLWRRDWTLLQHSLLTVPLEVASCLLKDAEVSLRLFSSCGVAFTVLGWISGQGLVEVVSAPVGAAMFVVNSSYISTNVLVVKWSEPRITGIIADGF